MLKAVDALVKNGGIQDEIFVQSGACDYIPKYYSSQPFLDRDAFSKKLDQCDLVISHGGTGAIISALKAGKNVIAVPRLSKYGEHVDDHQIQIVKQFAESGFISACQDMKIWVT